MKKIMVSLILVSSLACLFSSCTKLPTYKSTPVTILEDEFLTTDGMMRYYDADNKLEYGFGHDNEFLYLRFETKDPITQMKILNTGFKVYLDSTGKKKKRQYYQYPVAKSLERDARPTDRSRTSGQRPGRLDLKRVLMNVPKDVIAFEDGITRRINNLNNNEGFSFKLHAKEENTLIWEAAIPQGYIDSHDSEKGFVLGFVSGAMSSSMGSGRSGGRPSGGMPGGGRSGGGRPSGNGNNQGSGEMMQKMQQAQKPIDLWCAIEL